MNGTHHLARAVSDSTGLSHEELMLLVGAAAVGTTVLVLLRVSDHLIDAWPKPDIRGRELVAR